MGMSASQARLLAITSRMNDIELRSQQIANTKLRLADESEQVAQNYTNALNASKLTYTDYSKVGTNGGKAEVVSLTPSNITSLGFRLLGANGNDVTVKELPNPKYQKGNGEKETIPNPDYIANLGKITSTQMYEMIQSGQFMLQQKQTVNGNETWSDASVSSNTLIAISSDNTNLAKAEAEYNAATAKINSKEKQLDQQLKEMDTEHSALSTEQDSIKSLVKDNIDKTFNLFS